MEPDRRLNWKYKNCKISPICTHHPTWGKCGEPIDFGNAVRDFYWLIDFPDNTWINCGTKSECRKYIDSDRCLEHFKRKDQNEQLHPYKFNPPFKRTQDNELSR